MKRRVRIRPSTIATGITWEYVSDEVYFAYSVDPVIAGAYVSANRYFDTAQDDFRYDASLYGPEGLWACRGCVSLEAAAEAVENYLKQWRLQSDPPKRAINLRGNPPLFTWEIRSTGYEWIALFTDASLAKAVTLRAEINPWHLDEDGNPSYYAMFAKTPICYAIRPCLVSLEEAAKEATVFVDQYLRSQHPAHTRRTLVCKAKSRGNVV